MFMLWKFHCDNYVFEQYRTTYGLCLDNFCFLLAEQLFLTQSRIFELTLVVWIGIFFRGRSFKKAKIK